MEFRVVGPGDEAILAEVFTQIDATFFRPHPFTPEEARRILDKLEIHYTPKHGSWLNIAECELSAMTRQCLSRRIGDRETLSRDTKRWEQERNEKQKGVDWRFTTPDARIKLKRLYPTFQSE